MRKASHFAGKPVVTQSGEQIETIGDVIFDPQTHQALCFVLAPGGGWSGGAKILPWSHEFSIAANALVISSQDQIVLARTMSRIQAILENIHILVGQTIMTADGRRVGTLSDVYFDAHTGQIHQYEITRAARYIDPGHEVVVPPEEIEFEENDNHILLVSTATADRIEQHIRDERNDR